MPVFVVGFGRSGTTLAQRLVAQHFDLPTLPETHFFERLDKFGPSNGRLAADAAARMLAELQLFLDLDPARHQPLLSGGSVAVRALFLSLIEEQIGCAQKAAAGQWLEKTPAHLGRMSQIIRLFPNARFIVMVRNPLTAFASRRELAEPGRGWGEPWIPIEQLCDKWLRLHEKAEGFAALHPGRLLWVRLEDLSADLPRQLRRIGELLGRPPLDVSRVRPLAVRIVQPFEPWKQPALGEVDPALASRQGRSRLSADDSAQVHALLGAWMHRLGYLPTTVPDPIGTSSAWAESGVGSLDGSLASAGS